MRINSRTLNSLVISIIINIFILCFLAWLFQTQERPEEDAVTIDMVSIPQARRYSAHIMKRVLGQVFASSPSQAAVSPRYNPTMQIAVAPALKSASPFATAADFGNAAPQQTSLFVDGLLQQNITAGYITGMARGGQALQRSGHPNGIGPARGKSWLDGIREGITEAPMMHVEGTGKSISGYFNISQVKYEDTSDVIRTIALGHLAAAMNRWTMIKTQVLPDPINLDDPNLHRVPLIYIASRNAFAFSEKERENLRDYLYNGGFLLFSDISDELMADGPVANSIQFELWKILSSDYNLQPITSKHPLSNTFFTFSKRLPIYNKPGLLGVSLSGSLAVLYDAAGYGLRWAEGSDEDKNTLKLGVNIIVYALTQGQRGKNPESRTTRQPEIRQKM